MFFIRLNIVRERSEILQVILATLGVLITNAAIFGIGVYLALYNYGSSFLLYQL